MSCDLPALKALKAMVECSSEDRETVSGLVCLAAQMAFEVSWVGTLDSL